MTSSATVILMIAHTTHTATSFAARAITRSGASRPWVLLPPDADRQAALALLKVIGASDVWLWGTREDGQRLQQRVTGLGLLPIDQNLRYALDALESPQSLDHTAHRCGVPIDRREAAFTDPVAALDVFEEIWRRYLHAQAKRANLLPESPDIKDWTDSLSPHQRAMLACLRTARPDWGEAALTLAMLGVEEDHRLGPRL